MPKYDKQNNFSEGLAAVNIGYKTEMTDQMYDPREGYYEQTISEGKWGYIDERQNLVIPVVYDRARDFSGGIALVELDKKEFFINKKGEKVFDFLYDNISQFEEGLALVRKSEKKGFINNRGEEIIPLLYDDGHCFKEGLAPVKHEKLWGYINTNNEFVIAPAYSDASPFYEGLARVKHNAKYGCINKAGTAILPCLYDELDFHKIGLIEVKLNGKFVYFNYTGKQISATYDYSNQFYTGEFCVVGNGGKHSYDYSSIEGAKWGVINSRGEEVAPLTYNNFREAAAEMKKLETL